MALPYDRVYNFSAGPSTLPLPVLELAQKDLLNYGNTGMSVMEMSHRSKAFEDILEAAERNFRELLSIPPNYKILFLGGGASLQFSMVPISFLRGKECADYVITGSWGVKAAEAASIEGTVNKIFDGKAEGYRRVPELDECELSDEAAYLHITSNETIQGIQFKEDLTTTNPLICDMSSDILSRQVDISKYSLIYAGAQKNMGPAGVTVAVISDEMLQKVPNQMHPMLDYRLQAENGSMYNTPPCWNIYICGLVYRHLLDQGGLPAIQKQNEKKAKIIYDAIDRNSGFYTGHAAHASRSTMNITFTLPSEDLTKAFLKWTDAQKLDGLKGHRSVGGIRASIYNAFPEEGCTLLAELMDSFVKEHG